MRQMGKQKIPKRTFYKFGKIYEMEKNVFHRVVNIGYNLWMIVTDFSKRILWFGSCALFMFAFPMAFEIYCEQNKILTKI